ncbi:ArnT family glycosyltransferase [Maribellus maritimus]|uniref:ArnT family glycosyltransferase n=1 Tax=Maribellus maritimus TaxID=2870838 RepID=UPI001EEAF969|nr:glycosyltransferase family 39 protein [Maribellus maritimus]MCG6186494.1 glycosyltransferase family 39 protein [Maribellus maritimus]
MKNLDKRHYIIVGIWFLGNLLQALFTGLHSDESYYWMYSENLSWGFFDHPPMTALLIYLGHAVLPGEIGVRLIFILISSITFALILNELNEKKDLFFVSLFILSFPLIHTHIAGFMAIPDVPLLFFTTLFIISYRKFLKNPDWKISISLSLILAAMIYSKYHAFLIIGFTVLSNLKLFKNKYFYGIILLTVILLLPHVFWQIHNEFPTFKYHLVERAKPFTFKYILPYLGAQLAIAGPITGILIFWKLFRFKPENQFQKTLLFTILGFYIALFIISFKNRIEAHWIAAIIPMLIILTYPLIAGDLKFKRWFKRIALPVLVVMVLYRIYIALDVIPNTGHLKITFYNREASALEIKKLSEGKKVGFFNNYAAASNYIFYTGDSAVHLSTPTYRFCQFDLWDEEKYAEGEPLFTVQSKNLNPPNQLKTATGQTKGFLTIEKYQSLNGLTIKLEKTAETENKIEFFFLLNNNSGKTIYTQHVSNPVLAIMQNKTELTAVPLTASGKEMIVNNNSALISLSLSKKEIFQRNEPIIVYTRSKENYRGEIISLTLR